jgi:hypothetical protein
MSELLDAVLDVHGGLERWRWFSRVEATIVTGGVFWGTSDDPSASRSSVII